MPQVVVIVSVDWEGRSLLPENLAAIERFRVRNPDVPLQHFLNPAYFTRSQGEARDAALVVQAVLRSQDEQGLHVHAWRSLIEAAGVVFRDEPRFIDEDTPAPKARDDWGFYPPESGYDVPLETYTADEIEQVLLVSRSLLVSHGFELPRSFRAGGWMSGPNVQSALARAGCEVDCSAVDPLFAFDRFGDTALWRKLRSLWPRINETSRPYLAETPDGAIWQVPNNASLVDYASAERLASIFERNVENWRKDPTRRCFLSAGFHQETARTFLDELDRALELIRRKADAERLPLVFASDPRGFLPRLMRVPAQLV